MINKDRTRKYMAVFGVIAVFLIAYLIISNIAFGDDKVSSNTENMQAYIELQMERAELSKNLGEESTYPDFYAGVEEELISSDAESQAEAIDKTKEEILETEAICQYAMKNDVRVTDDEVDEYMDDVIAEAKTADNFAEIEAICQGAGTSFESTVTANRSLYEKRLLINKVYEIKQKEWSSDDIRTEAESEETDEQWNSFVMDTVKDYKKTEVGEDLSKALDNDEKIIESGVSAIDKIESLDMPVEGYELCE